MNCPAQSPAQKITALNQAPENPVQSLEQKYPIQNPEQKFSQESPAQILRVQSCVPQSWPLRNAMTSMTST